MRNIRRIRGLAAFLVLVTLLTSCQRASRYGPIPKPPPKEDDTKPEPLRPSDLWLEPKPRLDAPIVFVPATSEEWANLPAFWNELQPKYAGIRTSHLAQTPLAAAAGMALAWQLEVIKVKVPHGLPDPTLHIPKANPPTLGRWELGKQLFFDKILQTPSEKLSCASCHVPPRFCNDFPVAPQSTKNTPTLINSVFNLSQFWDGRAKMLEETIFGDAAKEAKSTDDSRPHQHHNWTAAIELLRSSDDFKQKYQSRFEQVFGIRQPTQDAIAKALATYVRTLLSGDSIVDHAVHKAKSPVFKAEHVQPLLDDAALRLLEVPKSSRAEVAAEIALGNELFHGKARCAECHSGPLYTDNDFHNVGLSGIADLFPGQETGRFVTTPLGLKQARLIGAFRTPSLRNLPRTAPYMHDGRFPTLANVIDYFNKIPPVHVGPSLAAPLLESPGRARELNLTTKETEALVRFLRALDGQPLDKKLVE